MYYIAIREVLGLNPIKINRLLMFSMLFVYVCGIIYFLSSWLIQLLFFYLDYARAITVGVLGQENVYW